MLQDLRALQAEVKEFRARLKAQDDVVVQNISSIDARITKEVQNLESTSDPLKHTSSNGPDLTRLWRLARSLHGLYSLNTTFYSFSRRKEEAVVVDIVYKKGHAWMIRNSLRFRSLVTELSNIISDDDIFSEITISQTKVVALGRRYLEVAGCNLKLGAMPSITIYFPRLLEECRHQEDVQCVQRVFEVLHGMGISSVTEIGPMLPFDVNVGKQVKDDFGNEEMVLIDQEAVQLDLTTLFVLVSDISNAELSQLTVSHQALEFQIQEEARVPCLKERLFPLIQNRPLFCTQVARDRFFEIVEELGSPYEKQRAMILFGLSSGNCAELSQISIHEWPSMMLPIQVCGAVHSDVPLDAEFKTRLASDCFECTWHSRVLVLSANLAAAKIFREALFGWPENVSPRPRIYLHAARSLTSYSRPKPGQ